MGCMYQGQIVIATVLDTYDDAIYKLMVNIKTGDLQSKRVLVAHKKEGTDLVGKDIIVRVDVPGLYGCGRKAADFFKKEDEVVAAYYITSEIPTGFEYSESNKIILYCIWQPEMMEKYPKPIKENIANFYYPGNIPLALRYSKHPKRRDDIVSYLIRGVKRTPIKRKVKEVDKWRTPGAALRKYITSMNKKFQPFHTRLIIIDSPLEDRILCEFNDKKIKKMGIEGYIKMD